MIYRLPGTPVPDLPNQSKQQDCPTGLRYRLNRHADSLTVEPTFLRQNHEGSFLSRGFTVLNRAGVLTGTRQGELDTVKRPLDEVKTLEDPAHPAK